MDIDKKYMYRCLQLARNGLGYANPNPMVGAVIVCNGKIIGEGFHREYGKPHAEVNAINSVKDKSLLRQSVIYVSLEPCSHYGKTPPCAKLIIDSGIPEVVVAMADPYPEVSGLGIKMLREAGVNVTVGILENEAKELNKTFLSSQTRHRPYVYLKWAQTSDGFIDRKRESGEACHPTPISNYFTRMLVHKLRAEIPAIMVGTNTVINDNPSLTTRYWYGKNPVRVVIDRQGRVSRESRIFDNEADTLVFTEQEVAPGQQGKTTFITIKFDEFLLPNLLAELDKRKTGAVLVEGGNRLLQSFIDSGLWDEAFIETAPLEFGDGTPAPVITGRVVDETIYGGSRLTHMLKY